MTDHSAPADDGGRPDDGAAPPNDGTRGPASETVTGTSTGQGTGAGVPPGAPAPGGADGGERGPGGGPAARWGLVRPRTGRQVAGVCAALGRATGTDPTLWRVLLAVLALFGGAGVVAYGLGWLLLPDEGDTSSPLEALLGRGRSRVSPGMTLLVGLVTVATLALTMSGGFRTMVLLGGLVVGFGLLRSRRATHAPPTPEPTAGPAPATPPPNAGYRPPFAPHGPYAAPAPTLPAYAQPAWSPPYAGPYLEQPVVPPPTPREKSILGRLTFFALVLVLGLLGLAHALPGGASIPVAAYFLAALTVIGAGLIVGAWMGRAYKLIPLGIVAAIGLALTTFVPAVGPGGPTFGSRTWQPTSVAAVDHRYVVRFGEGTIDLSHVDFTGQTVDVEVVTDFGNTSVVLPQTVDADITTTVQAGHAMVLGTESKGGPHQSMHVTDFGVDGKGGGTLDLHLLVRMGNVEVHR